MTVHASQMIHQHTLLLSEVMKKMGGRRHREASITVNPTCFRSARRGGGGLALNKT